MHSERYIPIIIVIVIIGSALFVTLAKTQIQLQMSFVVYFRVLSFNNDLIHLLELFYGRMLKLLPRKRNQLLILLPYPRGVMGVMGLVMQTKTLLSTFALCQVYQHQICFSNNCII